MYTLSIDLDKNRPCRYAFSAHLWNIKAAEYTLRADVLLDTGAYNTIINSSLVPRYANLTKGKMKVALGGFVGIADICIIKKMNLNGHIIENIAALAVPFKGELKDHILLGTNVINNWEITLSRQKHKLSAKEELDNYRYLYDSKGQVMSYQE